MDKFTLENFKERKLIEIFQSSMLLEQHDPERPWSCIYDLQVKIQLTIPMEKQGGELAQDFLSCYLSEIQTYVLGQ
jgi:hypothetical protein